MLLATVCLLNFAFSIFQLSKNVIKRRLMSGVWFLISYFSFLLLLQGISGSFTHLTGYGGYIIKITDKQMIMTAAFAFTCNLLFALGQNLSFMLFKPSDLPDRIIGNNSLARHMTNVYGLVLVCAAIVYGFNTYGHTYTDYVEYSGSNWSLVLLISSAPAITLALMQGRNYLASFFVLIFAYFVVVLQVRSFFFFSIVPLAFIYINRSMNKPDIKSRYIKPALIVLFLGLLSAFFLYLRAGVLELPEVFLARGMNVAMQELSVTTEAKGWNSLGRFGYGFVGPLYRLFDSSPLPEDTPEYLASLIEGMAESPDNFYHYPLLWYTDAFASFRVYGALLGLFWGGFLAFFEFAIRRSTLIFCLLLPYYCWMAYMIVRGATGNSSNSITYVLYIQAIFALFFYLCSKTIYRNNENWV